MIVRDPGKLKSKRKYILNAMIKKSGQSQMKMEKGAALIDAVSDKILDTANEKIRDINKRQMQEHEHFDNEIKQSVLNAILPDCELLTKMESEIQSLKQSKNALDVKIRILRDTIIESSKPRIKEIRLKYESEKEIVDAETFQAISDAYSVQFSEYLVGYKE